MNKHDIINNLCFTELVYGRINKKLNIKLSKQAIEEFIVSIIKETEETYIVKIGKNIYITNMTNKIKITINSNTYRLITADILSQVSP